MSNDSPQRQRIVFPESLLAHQLLDGLKGLEIGASAHNPFGLNTRNVGLLIDGYIQEQRDNCGYAVDINIEAPAHAIPLLDESEDFIISSHVVEHCPDLIRNFLEWFRIIRQGGYLFMIVPHRDASSYDVGRPLTDWPHICEDYRNRVGETSENDPNVYANIHCHIFAIETLKEFVAGIFGDRLTLVDEQSVDDKVGNGFTLAYRKTHSLADSFPWHVQAPDGERLTVERIGSSSPIESFTPSISPKSPVIKAILVSAIVSTYNSEIFMRGCLEDLTSQSLFVEGRMEIIVVDSASPQNEGSIVREFQKQYGNNLVYIRTDVRETLYAAWNRGIAAARGMYLTNANTDDRHRQDALEVMCQVLDQHPEIDLVYGDCFVSTISNETFERNVKNRIYRYPTFSPPEALLHYQFGPQPMWRKSVHEKIGFFDDKFKAAGDYDFNIRFALQCRALHIPQPLGLYLEHQNALSFKDNSAVLENLAIKKTFRLPEIIEKLYRQAGVPSETDEEKSHIYFDMGIKSLEFYSPWNCGKAESDYIFAIQCLQKARSLLPAWPPLWDMNSAAIMSRGNVTTRSLYEAFLAKSPPPLKMELLSNRII